MSLPTTNPSPPQRSSRRDTATLVEYDKYIDAQIERTRRTVKMVDVAATLLVVGISTLAYLFVAAVVEHWIVPGGFGTGTRLLLAAILFGGVGYYIVRRLWPAAIRPINPVYAARTIEESSPGLKNSLLNLLLFRQHRDELSPAVYEALEEQAAQRLSHVAIETAVDHAPIIRLGYVLLAVLILASLYKVLSPKDPLVTAGRVLAPWSEVPPPSRVTIENVQPGNLTVARGDRVDISTEVRGLRETEGVTLLYSTADGQAVDRPVPMTSGAADGFEFKGQLPESSAYDALGLLQDVHYRVKAGDAVSREFRIKVVPAPAIFVKKVEFDYPAYTGYVDRTIEEQGDLRAIEGTRLTIHAEANCPIQEAFVDFEADGRRDLPMEIDGTNAHVTFTVALRPDRRTPQHASYALRFENEEGQPNREPPQYEIDVLPDLSPEVEIISPEEPVRDVKLRETVEIELAARDPDFALSGVRVRCETSGRQIMDAPILQPEHTGRFTGRVQLTPSRLGLRPGDVVEYWAVARDNRTPDANEALSKRQTFRIVSPDPNEPPPDQVARREQPNRDAKEQPQPDGALDENAEGGQQGQSRDQGEQGQNDQRGDGGQNERNGVADANSRQDGKQDPQGEQQPAAGQSKPDQGDGQQSADGKSAGEQDKSGGEGQRQPGTPQNGNGNSPAERMADGQSKSDQAADNESQPVAPTGEDDGEAFERIVRHFQKQQPRAHRDGSPDTTQDQHGSQNRSSQGQSSGDDPQPGEADVDRNERRSNGDQKIETEKTAQGSAPDGAQPSADATKPDAVNRTSPEADQNNSTDGGSGNGDAPDTGQTPPDSQQPVSEQSKQKDPGGKPDDVTEPPMQNNSRKASDSQGELGGDHSGGGEEGAGQQTPREGTGSSGQHQAAEEGAGQSTEPGAGEISPGGGQKTATQNETNKQGQQSQPGGTSQREGTGQQPGGEPSKDQPAGDNQSANGDGESQQMPGEQGVPQGGGVPGAGNQGGQATRRGSSEPGGDDPNLAYTRKQTDLVLEKLADQLDRDQVDRELLDRLGWSEEDLRRFVERWQELAAAARDGSEQSLVAQKELDDALRSLGLKPRSLSETGEAAKDDLRDIRRGIRGPVPLEYQERLRAYSRGISQDTAEEPAGKR